MALPASDLTTPPSLLHRATPLQLHQDQSGGRSDQLQYSSSLAPSTADPQPAAVGRSSPPSPGVHGELAPEALATLTEARRTMASAAQALDQDAPLQQDVRETLRELSKSAQSLRMLTDYLERHPEALIKGKQEDRE